MSQHNFDRLLQKYLAGECTEEEEKIVLEWYETLINSSDLHLSEAEKSRIESKLWNAITANVQAHEQTQAKVVPAVTSRTWFRVAAAACLLMIAGAGVIWYLSGRNTNKQTVLAEVKTAGFDSLINTTHAEKELMLADSSVINLQPGAAIYYPRTFSDATRDVYLQGSAFFKVYHNPLKHFKVHMNSGLTTEVLGTTFNIVQNKSAGKIEVAVVTGKVLVYRKQAKNNTVTDSTEGVILTRNKKVIYNATSSRFTTGIVDNPQPLSKTKASNGATNTPPEQLAFEEEPLQHVLQALSNIYGISIVAENENVAARHFTGNLSGYDMHTQLDAICKAAQTTYEINGTQITIKENQNK